MCFRDTLSAQNSHDAPISGRAPELPQSPPFITFSAGQALWKLYQLWRGGDDAPLRLSLLSGEDPCNALLGDTLPREHQRLQLLLNDAAQVRLEALNTSPDALDERALVFLTRNELVAWLFLFPAVGQGRALTNGRLQQALLRHNITTGIRWDTLRQLPTLPQRHFRMVPIAVGTAPIPGRDGRITDHFPRSIGAEVQVDVLAHEDYESLHLVRDIEENDVICDIFPATKGTPGLTVTGRALDAPDGHTVSVPQGRNTCLSEDGLHLVAACRGHVVFSGRSFHVKPVLELQDPPVSPQQVVKFLGDIHIHGDLPDGASVYAIGTVQVDGAVGACTIEAGENIILSSGAQGVNRASLRAQRSVYAKYLDHCTVYARESVQADCIIRCEIYSNDMVRVRTGLGAIIGGTVRATREVSATMVGSQAHRPTQIFLGGQPCEEAERAQVLQEIEDADQTIAELSRRTDEEAVRQLPKLKLHQGVAKLKLEKFDRELEAAAKALEAEDCRLLCDTAYPGTVVTIRHREIPVDQITHPCAIGAAGGHVGWL